MPRYAHPTDFGVVADCFTSLHACQILGIDGRTLIRWRRGESRIPWAAYQLLYEHSKYGQGERDAAEHFERSAVLGERDALKQRVAQLEQLLIAQSRLVDWGCANDPFIDPADPRAAGITESY